jgi:hypothetical protein
MIVYEMVYGNLMDYVCVYYSVAEYFQLVTA